MKIQKHFNFQRIHCMGPRIQGKTRPIIAKFQDSKDRGLIRRSAPEVLKGQENKQFGTNEHFPKEINDKRKKNYIRSINRPNEIVNART